MKKRVVALTLAFAMVFSVAVRGLTSDKLEDLEDRIDAGKAELEELEKLGEEISQQLAQLQQQSQENWDNIVLIAQERALVDRQVAVLNQHILKMEEQITDQNLLIAAKQEQLDAAQEKHRQLNTAYKERIQVMEEHGTVSFWSVLFKANSFMDLLDRLHMIQEIAQADRRRLAELEKAAQAVETARNALQESKEELQEQKQTQQQLQEQLRKQQDRSQVLMDKLLEESTYLSALVADFEDREGEVLQQILNKKNELQDLDDAQQEELDRLKEEEENRKNEEDAPVSPAGWMRPCNYILLTSPWGYRVHPISGEWKMHYGVDLAGWYQTPIVATRAGVVTVASDDPYGYGNFVEIDHRDGFSSLYAHMTHFIVSVGQVVAQGQVIGYMGSTGASQGTHLHFGVYYNNQSVNPMEYID